MTGVVPPTASRSERLALGLAIAMAILAAFVGPPLLRGVIGRRAAALPENTPARARLALARGDDAALRLELARIDSDVPVRGNDGPELLRAGVLDLTNGVPELLSLAAEAIGKGKKPEAREAAFAAFRRLHLRPRALEEAEPWRLLALAASTDSDRREALAVLAATAPPEFLNSFARDPDAGEAGARARAAGAAAIVLAGTGASRHPERLPPIAARPPAAAPPLPPKSAWRRADSPWFGNDSRLVEDGRLFGSAAVETILRVDRPAGSIVLSLSGRSVLGIAPILLVSIDGGEPHPVYADRPTETAVRIDAPVAAGTHVVRVEYWNDFRLDDRRDRGVTLFGVSAGDSPDYHRAP